MKRNWKRPSTVTPARLFPRYKGLSFRLQVSGSAFQSRKQALGIAAINGAKHICREPGCGRISNHPWHAILLNSVTVVKRLPGETGGLDTAGL